MSTLKNYVNVIGDEEKVQELLEFTRKSSNPIAVIDLAYKLGLEPPYDPHPGHVIGIKLQNQYGPDGPDSPMVEVLTWEIFEPDGVHPDVPVTTDEKLNKFLVLSILRGVSAEVLLEILECHEITPPDGTHRYNPFAIEHDGNIAEGTAVWI